MSPAAAGPLPGFRVPDELSARVPPEQRGPGSARDAVRLLVSGPGGDVSHHAFRALPGLLRAGDVLVVNTSRTLPAAVDGRVVRDRGLGEPVVVHFSTRGDDGRWAVELRVPDGSGSTGPRPGGPAGTRLRLPGGARLELEEPLDARGGRLWWGRVTGGRVPALMERYGRPVRYGYTERDQPLSAYQTVFAERPVYAEPPGPPGRVPCPAADGGGARQGSAPQAPGDGPSEGAGDGSAEMPSAARPFTAELVAELVSRGVQVAPLRLHTGVASAEAYEPPYPERFAVPEATAWLVNAARAAGGRVVAVGTTAVRALESAAGTDGVVRAAAGWTDLVVTPRRGVRVVDGLLTGLHEPEASHLLMLEAVAGRAGPAGRAALVRGYAAALAERYLWHEFGDSHLILSR